MKRQLPLFGFMETLDLSTLLESHKVHEMTRLKIQTEMFARSYCKRLFLPRKFREKDRSEDAEESEEEEDEDEANCTFLTASVR